MDGKKVKLRLEHISQSYIVKNEVSDAVVDVSLDVYDNEFLVILGPGRCGKTVLLNMIAGLEKPVDGSLFLDGEEIHGSDERIGMVFQKLALMPWKTVMENVEFGLKMKGVPKAQRRETAQKYINLVGLQGFEKKLSQPALRRHEAAGRHCPRLYQQSGDHADGRALRTAGRPDPIFHAGRGAANLGK